MYLCKEKKLFKLNCKRELKSNYQIYGKGTGTRLLMLPNSTSREK